MGLDLDRLACLEGLCAKQQTVLDALLAKQQALQKLFETLRQQHNGLAAEHEVLTTCLTTQAILSSTELNAARQQTRCCSLVRDFLQVPGLAQTLGQFAGVRASEALASTSKVFHDAVAPALQAVVAGTAPHFYMCGGSSSGSFLPLALVERLHPESGVWETLPAMPTARRWCGAAAMGGLLYVIGGEIQGSTLAACECFDPSTSTWESLPAMPTARAQCAVTAEMRTLQVFGGRELKRSFAAVESFDPLTKRWESLPSMSRVRDACAAAAHGGLAYVVGGRESDQNMEAVLVTSVERLDIKKREWSSLPPLPTPRVGCGAVLCSGSLFAFGGHVLRSEGASSPALSIVERLDLSTETWERVHSMPTARSHCTAVASGDRIHVFGRSYVCTLDCLPAVETWDYNSAGASNRGGGSWQSLQAHAPTPTPRFAFAVAALRL
mmetsp:Transcript_68923/g.165418  ORF Transcript_68923/g.165418 Transcript_68923/m.165418 type:complete len:439 (-) Transcript_68923:58-1374(-)